MCEGRCVKGGCVKGGVQRGGRCMEGVWRGCVEGVMHYEQGTEGHTIKTVSLFKVRVSL